MNTEEEQQPVDLEAFEDAAADLIGAAQGALQEFERTMAEASEAHRKAYAEARAEHGRAVAALEQIARRGQEMAERQKAALHFSERQWANILERAAREGGGAMAETVGKGIADGIARRLDGTSRDAERAAARLEAA
ncbi:MAG: hypothetical protein PHS60_11135, partial [Zavarzinia sp.]|nr:hypothetical protein [Zavarzinia sp.]